MRYNRSSSKSSLFLIELLIIIAFFSVASVVCVRLFVRSNAISLDSRDLNRAVTLAQSAAEGFKAVDGDGEEVARLIDGSVQSGGAVVAYYDRNWQPVDAPTDRGYSLRVQISREGQLALADIEVLKQADTPEEIYSLQTKHLVTG